MSFNKDTRECSQKSKKGRGGRLNRFLLDVLQTRDDLTWLDKVAYQMRSTELLQVSPDLREKLNAIFFNSDTQVWTPRKNTNVIIRQRSKRHSRQRKSSSPKPNENPTYNKKALASKILLISRKRKYNAGSLLQQNFNSTIKSPQKIRTKNRIATTADPLEKILQSINVFPVEDDRDAQDDSIAGLKFNDDAAKNDVQSPFFKHDTLRVSSRNESFGVKNSRVQRSLKSSASVAETGIIANNLELSDHECNADRVENKKATNGDLAKEIVDAIFNKIKVGGFSVPIFVSQYHTLPVNSMLEKSNRENNHFAVTDENEIIPRRIMTIVQRLISEEVEKKSCTALQPELYNFLEWLVNINTDNDDNVDLLRENINNIIKNKPTRSNPIVNVDEWYRKSQRLKHLLNEYYGLSKKDKSKVQVIYEYLVSRFEFVEAYIKALRSHELSVEQLLKIRID